MSSHAGTEFSASPRRPAFATPWLLSPVQDLVFLLGSAILPATLLVLWLYETPLPGIGPLTGGKTVLLWVFVFHGPHFWATWSRTIVDRSWWAGHRRDFRLSMRWILAGPVVVGTSLLIQAGTGVRILEQAFLFFAAIWAYHHVVKQHFGFMALYRAKAGEFDRGELMIHKRWLITSLWLPVLIVLLNHPDWVVKVPGLEWLVRDAVGVRPFFWFARNFATAATWTFVGLQALAIGWLARNFVIGRPINVGETLTAATAVALHWFAVTAILTPPASAVGDPLAGYIFVPLVTMFHNVQYHALVWHYNRVKFPDAQTATDSGAGNLAWALNRNLPVYFAFGLVYTVLTIGLELWPQQVGLDWRAAIAPWQASFIAACIWGFSFVHYDLDARIWKVSHDPDLRRVLGLG